MSELSKQEVGLKNPVIQVILLFGVLLLLWGLFQPSSQGLTLSFPGGIHA